MVFKPNYDAILDETAKRMSLSANTYSGDKRDQSISSGMLCTDLILGNAGWVPGWHTSLGFEQSAKTTSATHTLHEALKLDVPILQVWDYEKSYDVKYARTFFNNTAMTASTFGKMNDKGTWDVKPRIRAYDEHTAEAFFDSLHKTLKALPRKAKIGNNWFYVFEKTKAAKAIVGEKYSKVLYKQLDKYCVEAENGRPQGFIILDSYPAMLPEKQDEDENNNSMAMQARMFSDQIKRVKGLIGSRGIVLLGINQMRLRPAVMFGNPEYEPGGEALKLFSDVRLLHKACATPAQYKILGDRDGGNMVEPSLDGEGTDVYRYITIDIAKNKMGGSPRGTRIHQRIWVMDENGQGRGLDPVFDTFQYLMLTNQAEGNVKKFTLSMKGSPLDKKTITYEQLKTLVIGNVEQQKKVCKTLKVTQNPKLRATCFKQLANGSAYDLMNEIETAKVEKDL